jgi:hypothetical protein
MIVEPEMLKLIPKVDEYNLEWIRNKLNAQNIRIAQLESLVVVFIETCQKNEADLHRCQVQRQADMMKIAEMCMEHDDLKKINAALVDRIAKCESRIDKASELLASIRKDQAAKNIG